MSENQSDSSTRPSRREFLACISAAAGLHAMSRLRPEQSAFANDAIDDVVIVEFTAAGAPLAPARVPKIVKPENEWRKQLSPLAFEITRRAGTERSFTGAYWNLHEKGIFRCVCCNTAPSSTARCCSRRSGRFRFR